jgi:hypothetical protein
MGKGKVTDFPKNNGGSKQIPKPSEFITRQEFVEVLTQITSNMNEMTKYLTEDVNAMFSKHVYPNYMRLQAVEILLNELGFVTREEVDKKAKELFEKAVKTAKEMTESGEIKIETEEVEGKAYEGLTREEEVPVEEDICYKEIPCSECDKTEPCTMCKDCCVEPDEDYCEDYGDEFEEDFSNECPEGCTCESGDVCKEHGGIVYDVMAGCPVEGDECPDDCDGCVEEFEESEDFEEFEERRICSCDVSHSEDECTCGCGTLENEYSEVVPEEV